MYASFRTISFKFEAVRGEYLSRTQWATQRPAILSMLQKEIYGKPYVRRIFGASLSEPHTDKFRFCRVYIYIYAPYVRLTVNFHLQHGQDGRPLRGTLRATQILATDSFKREGNRTKRSGHYNLSPRQGYRHRKKE